MWRGDGANDGNARVVGSGGTTPEATISATRYPLRKGDMVVLHRSHQVGNRGSTDVVNFCYRQPGASEGDMVSVG
jgi:hypothetical protein